MAGYLRLRQICLVADALEPLVGDIAAILETGVCYRDPAVAHYGLENAVLPIGSSFLEVVAPTRSGTAAGRFLDRSAGHGGYMAIFDCDDPEPRRRHVEALGIRVAHVIRHDDYVGVQLHPRDCRAAMIEFNHTRDGDALDGPYHPAGPGWPATRHSSPVTALIEVEIESPDPDGLAAHWARMLAVPLSRDDHGEARIVLAHGAVRFARVPAGQPECLGGLRIAVADVARTCAAAARRGHAVTGTSFHLGGVRFRIVSPA